MEVISSLVLHFYLNRGVTTIARSYKVNKNDRKEKK